MKTTADKTNFPTLTKLFVFVILISGLAFASCLVAQAQVFYNINNYTRILENLEDGYANVIKSGTDLNEMTTDQVWAYRLKSAIVEVSEADVELESWMYSSEMFEATDIEAEIRLEDWMTDYFNNTFDFLIVDPEQELELEEWMLDIEFFVAEPVVEDPLDLEDWMIN